METITVNKETQKPFDIIESIADIADTDKDTPKIAEFEKEIPSNIAEELEWLIEAINSPDIKAQDVINELYRVYHEDCAGIKGKSKRFNKAFEIIQEKLEAHITFNSPDYIPTSKEIPPIDIISLGIPEGNIIHRFIDYLSFSDPYPEYVLQNALMMISASVQRRMYIPMNAGRIYPNLWIGYTGHSGTARKSVPIKRMQKIVRDAIGNLFLGDDINPASLIQDMATLQKTRIQTQDGHVIWAPQKLESPHREYFSNAHKCFCRDEAGQLFRQMEMPTHAGFKDLLLRLHSCETYDKKLTNEYKVIENPYLTMIWATTTDTLKDTLTKHDINSGLLARTLYTNPTYEKPRISINDKDDDDPDTKLKRETLVNQLKKIDQTLSNTTREIKWILIPTIPKEEKEEEQNTKSKKDKKSKTDDNISKNNEPQQQDQQESKEPEELKESQQQYQQICNPFANPIRVYYEPGALEILDVWAGEREKYYMHTNDDQMSAFVARFQENAIRIAVIIELGNIPWLTKGSSSVKIKKFVVSRAAIESALKLIDCVFMPYANQLANELPTDKHGTAHTGISNAILRVEQELAKRKKVDRRTAYRDCKMLADQFDDCLKSMMRAGSARVVYVRGKLGKKIPWLVHVPFSDRVKFEHDYTSATVSAYKSCIEFENYPGEPKELCNKNDKLGMSSESLKLEKDLEVEPPKFAEQPKKTDIQDIDNYF